VSDKTEPDRPPTCACGLNLNIWQNPWNHEPGCLMRPAPEGGVTALRYERCGCGGYGVSDPPERCPVHGTSLAAKPDAPICACHNVRGCDLAEGCSRQCDHLTDCVSSEERHA
jgi:hypothetical protein